MQRLLCNQCIEYIELFQIITFILYATILTEFYYVIYGYHTYLSNPDYLLRRLDVERV